MAESAWTVLADASIRALARIMLQKGLRGEDVGYARISTTLREVLTERIDQTRAEWKEATEAHIGPGWSRELMNAQASETALEAARRLGI